MAGSGGNGGGLLVRSGAGGGPFSVVGRLGWGSMRQSPSVGTITFSEVPGGAELDPYFCTTSHSRPSSLSEATVMGRVSGSVCCPSWWTCISTVTLPSDSSVTHGIPAMASKSSFSCACVLCTFMELYLPLV